MKNIFEDDRFIIFKKSNGWYEFFNKKSKKSTNSRLSKVEVKEMLEKIKNDINAIYYYF